MAIPSKSFFWHDYETFGINPRIDRPSQFAGIRTDENLKEIGVPLVLYCKPANDFLPSPEACIITGITPQIALKNGVSEAEFFSAIHREMMRPNTCGVGYNSIKFDDEVTRHGLYRNLYNAYEREFKNCNSRWDIINVIRMVFALRPGKFNWPLGDDGKPTFRLEKLTKANGIPHDGAHDALSDVRATIGLARLIKEREPKLFDFLFNNRNKHMTADLLKIGEPVLHVASTYSVDNHFLSLVLPIAKHPTNNNGVIVYDLNVNPQPLLAMTAEDIKKTLYKKAGDLADGEVRVPLKLIQINKCPALAPRNALRPDDAIRTNFDGAKCDAYARQIISDSVVFREIQNKVADVFKDDIPADTDPDLMLYCGGFLDDADNKTLLRVHKDSPDLLSSKAYDFHDQRLPEMLFRYRARNYPEYLTPDEKVRWEDYRLERIEQFSPGYLDRLELLMNDARCPDKHKEILIDLRGYAVSVMTSHEEDALGKSCGLSI